MSYTQFVDHLAPLDGRCAVWQRQMVLGPGDEFVIMTHDVNALPAPLPATAVDRVPLVA